MSPNETRRRVMICSWGMFRAAVGQRTFADCLRASWAYIKRLASGAAPTRHLRFSRSLIQSPIGRRASYGSHRDYSAAYLTARLGQ